MINRHPAHTSIQQESAAQLREVTSAWITANALTKGRAVAGVRAKPELEMSSIVLDAIGQVVMNIEHAVKSRRRHPARCNLRGVLKVLHE